MTSWEIHGLEFGNCNCDYSCPCQFLAPPTHGNCQAVDFFRIEKGHHGDIALDGLNMAIAVKWPGPVHAGKGTMQPILDQTADAAQSDALLRILTGKDTDDFATVFNVYSAMCDTILEPVHTAIAIEADMASRTATCEAAGIATGRGEPVRNPVSGAEHRIGMLMPDGFEFTRNECGRGWSSSSGDVAMDLADSYAHWCEIHMNQHGVIR